MRHLIIPIALLAAPAWTVAGAPITYNVSVDTSSISGTAGSLDSNFNPGPLASQSAFLQILNFTTDGTLAGAPAVTGDVSGAPLATLTFDNGTAFNRLFRGIYL